MAKTFPPFKLANGVLYPPVSIGCAHGNWADPSQPPSFTPEEASPALEKALRAGHRSFDGAHFYCTERLVGNVLARHFAAGDLKRSDLFITSKIAHPQPEPGMVNPFRALDPAECHPRKNPGVLEKTLFQHFYRTTDDLGFAQVDLLLIHWPAPFKVDWNDDVKKEWRAKCWNVMNEIYKRGGARAIGVSNHTLDQIDELIDAAKKSDGALVAPMVNQIEVHPYCFDRELIEGCQRRGVHVTAYAPFASGAFGVTQDPAIVAIAGAHKKTPGQVILRWLHQHGISALPKSHDEGRLKQSLEVGDFELTADEVQQIDELGKKMQRTCGNPYEL